MISQHWSVPYPCFSQLPSWGLSEDFNLIQGLGDLGVALVSWRAELGLQSVKFLEEGSKVSFNNQLHCLIVKNVYHNYNG